MKKKFLCKAYNRKNFKSFLKLNPSAQDKTKQNIGQNCSKDMRKPNEKK